MFDYDGKTGNPYYNEIWNTLSAEDTMCGSLQDRWMHLFTQYSIAELFGLSFNDFIQGDMATCINILKIAKNAAKIKGKALGEAESLLQANSPSK